jgi:phage shock protein E
MFGLFSNAKRKKIERFLQEDAQLLDVRTSGEYEKGHIPGSVSAPIHKVDQYIDQLDPSKPVITYCAMGGRSALAATKLKKRGFKVVDAQGKKFVERFLKKAVQQ